MHRTPSSGIILTLLLVGMLTSVFDVQSARDGFAVYIRSDGSIYPQTAPIVREGDLYTLTGNIFGDPDGINIERNHMTLDGAGYTLQGNEYRVGLNLYERNNVTIKNLKIEAFSIGLDLVGSSGNIISGNNITNNGSWGIFLFLSSNNTLRNNDVSDNRYNFAFSGWSLTQYIQDIDNSNTVNGKPVYYWVNRRDMAVPLDAGWVGLVNCTNITVENLNLKNNLKGVLLVSTTNSTITKNEITNNGYGIMLELSSSDNAISGNSITNNGDGIWVDESSNHNTISGNNMTENGGSGISLQRSSNNVVYGNNMKNNGYGISLEASSNNNTVSGNSIANNSCGIHLRYSSNNTLRNNDARNNECNFCILGDSLSDFVQDIDDSNIVDGKSVRYWVNKRDMAVPLDAGFVTLVNCTGITVKSLRLTNNRPSILLAFTTNSTIINNNITNSEPGISIHSSNHNSIYHNSFTAEYESVYSRNATNTWDNGYPSGGNYWSNHPRVDNYYGINQDKLGSDGITDEPYIIDATNQDNYPLMEPWTELSWWDIYGTMVAVVLVLVSVAFAGTAALVLLYVKRFKPETR